MLKQITISGLLISFVVLFSCNKKETRVPYVPVDLYLNISIPSNTNLNFIGGWNYVSGGSKGIVVYRQTADTFTAYDRHCTYEIEANCDPATVDSTNLAISCDCDGSQYQIYDGAVINGPAVYPLQQYQASYNSSTNILHIYN